jgi:hypothetical protein
MPIALVPKSVPKCDGINSCVSADDQFSIKESNNCKPPQDDSLIPTSRCTRAKEKAITESSCRYSLRLLARSHQPRKQLQEDPFQKSSPIEGSMIPNTGFSRNTRRRDYCATSDTTNCSRSGSNKKRKTRGNSRSAVDCGILPSEWYRIKASATTTVPWGYICGYPVPSGDLYGGGHYIRSAAGTTTLQGRAILEATKLFGDGATLPFTPCKRGYQPVVDGIPMYACSHHHQERKKRFQSKTKLGYRLGEAKLEQFWRLPDEIDKISKT